MKKEDIIQALTDAGIEAPEGATNKELMELLPSAKQLAEKEAAEKEAADLQQENEDFELLYESVVEGMAAASGPAAPEADEEDEG